MHKRALIIAAILAFMAGHHALACSPAPPRESYTNSKEIIEVKIGDTYFQFPSSFFYFPDDRLPIERDYVNIRVYLPDFKGPPELPPSGTHNKERQEWNNRHPSVTIILKELGVTPKGFSSSDGPRYALDGRVEIQFWGGNLTPEDVGEKLKPFMSSKPSADWAKNQALAKALNISKEHDFVNPCAAFARVKPEQKPEPPLLVSRDIIEQGLTHKNQAIRMRAVRELGRYELSEEVIQRLYKVARTDKEPDVRLAAISAMRPYKNTNAAAKPLEGVGSMLVELFKHEKNDEVIDSLGGQMNRDPQSFAPALVDDMPKAKGNRLYQEAKIMAWSVNREAQQKLTEYSQLSPQAKKYLDAVMDFYERPDVDDEQKGRISNILKNSKTAIATPRYVTLMIKQNAILELGYLASDPERTVSHLIKELKSNRVGNYKYAVETLSKFGPKAQTAIPYLLPLLKHNCPEKTGLNREHIVRREALNFNDPTTCHSFMVSSTRQATAYALGEIGNSSPEVLAALYEALGDKDTAQNAGSTLLKLEPDQAKLMNAMLHHLETSDKQEVKVGIITILGKQGSKAVAAVPTLRKLCEISDDDSANRAICNSAQRALEKITSEKIPSPPVTIQAPPTASLPSSSSRLKVSEEVKVPMLEN